jgi:hypothetical protein
MFQFSTTQLIQQPHLCEFPVSANRFRGYMQNFRGFFDTETTEKSELYDPAFPVIYFGQAVQGIIQGNDIGIRFAAHRGSILQGEVEQATTSLLVTAGASKVDQNAAHQLGGHGKKMRPILPIYLSAVYEPQVHLVYERGSLESVARSLPGHIALRYPVQLVIDKRREFFQSFLITGGPSLK